MTELSFHFNVLAPVDHACRVVRKAVRSGASVTVTAEPALLTELDAALWTFSATDFVPHAYPRPDAEGPNDALVPVLLIERPGQVATRDILLNLGASVPVGFERFARVIEVVGLGATQRREARLRWKHYADRGYSIERFDLQHKGAA